MATTSKSRTTKKTTKKAAAKRTTKKAAVTKTATKKAAKTKKQAMLAPEAAPTPVEAVPEPEPVG